MRENVVPILFYQHDEAGSSPPPPLPHHLYLHVWLPRHTAICRIPGADRRWLVWSAFHYCHVFHNRDFALQILLDAQGLIVHRASIFPPYFRFPFMEPGDLQVGDVWTHPLWRRQGLAAWSINSIASPHSQSRTVWYLTDARNLASARSAQKAGYRLVATGERASRSGVPLLAKYRLLEWC